MENWKIYREDEIPKDVYIGDISYAEDNNPVIKLENWHNGRIINYIKLEFKNMYSVRVFEEGKALNKIFEDIMKFKPDRRKNVIYEVEDGDYAKEVRKIVGKKLIGTKIYQYVIMTENYFFEIVTASEPVITMMEEKAEKEAYFRYWENYRLNKVDLIFKHLEEPVYMSKDESRHETGVEFTEGEYHYKYLLGDGLELIDKENKDICVDGGELWSVLTIGGDGAIEKEIDSSVTFLEYGIFHKMMEIVPENIEPKVFIAGKDKQAACILSFNEIRGLHAATVAWYKPDGELHRFAENNFGSYEEADDDKVMLRFWLDIDQIDETDFGNWKARAFLDGEMIKEDDIIISGDGVNKIGI
jgi:hypothetical protein